MMIKTTPTQTANDVLAKSGIDPTKVEVFPPTKQAPFGSYKYFAQAIDAGYFGCDDSQMVSFRPIPPAPTPEVRIDTSTDFMEETP